MGSNWTNDWDVSTILTSWRAAASRTRMNGKAGNIEIAGRQLRLAQRPRKERDLVEKPDFGWRNEDWYKSSACGVPIILAVKTIAMPIQPYPETEKQK